MGELAGEPAMKLLCSLPGIEQTLLSVLQTLTSHISESRDREGRLHQRVDDLSTQLLALREEFCSLQKSAIVVPDKAPARSTQHQVQGDKSRTRTKPRNRPPQQGQPDPAAAANQLDPAGRCRCWTTVRADRRGLWLCTASSSSRMTVGN
eukprot:scpid95782/ scgid4366/ 